MTGSGRKRQRPWQDNIEELERAAKAARAEDEMEDGIRQGSGPDNSTSGQDVEEDVKGKGKGKERIHGHANQHSPTDPSGHRDKGDLSPSTLAQEKIGETSQEFGSKTEDDGGVSERPNTAREWAEYLRRYRKAQQAALETKFKMLEQQSVLAQQELEALQAERQVDKYAYRDLR